MKIALTILVSLFAAISLTGQSFTPSFQEIYDKENDRTAVYMKPIEIPRDSRKFSVGAAYEFIGSNLTSTPCCMTMYFFSIGKKGFEYKEKHEITIWADKERMVFKKPLWKENDHATAFVIAQIAYPEELWFDMKIEQFRQIVSAKRVKVQVGKFKFVMTEDQRKGLAAIAERFERIGK